MAEIINLRENEYQTIISELSKMHAGHLQNVDAVIKEIKALVTSEEGFSVNQTSRKMEDMVDVLSADVMELLKQAFQDSETGISSMITSTVETDSACG